MTYRELLQGYKTGQLDEEKRLEIEADIEKHDAISEYLFDNNDISGISETSLNSDIPMNSNDDTMEKAADFTRMVKRSIHMAFIKVGVVTALVTLAIVAFCLKGLPKIIDQKYYNPAEQVGGNGIYGTETSNKLTIDIATYSEAFMPTRNIVQTSVESRGFGNYYVSFIRNNNTYSGTIEKGQLRLYNPDAINKTIRLTYAMNEKGETGCYLTSPNGNDFFEDNYIEYLSDYDYYYASVTLSKAMRYDDFLKWCDKNDISADWCAINVDMDSEDPTALPHKYTMSDPYAHTYEPCIGFGGTEAHIMYYDNEKYPTLSLFDTLDSKNEGREKYDVAVEHVCSMLSYLSDNPEIFELFGHSDDYGYERNLSIDKERIEKEGLYVYGFVTAENKTGLQRIKSLENVSYVVADEN
ncbi:anti sigma factor C-terminal domain-containing protein [Butyrivibrio sp. INlla16]|uniref:anti sigma factor C-terminal domain-containing protein n=1 Tax=Butyrivibrio sp. INlla16 TaxID=1520807 RepID=UPI0008805A73|nr:anti sigma factor C-terminal domain-containing protein [Butyrivibrio sp. INlla16]SDB68643.1 Sigma factor regulator C-terminal [Butyrivibrio sp. INlla16]